MDKNVIKIIGLLTGLVVIIAIILLIAINGLKLGIFEVVSVSGIANKREEISKSKQTLDMAEGQYEVNLKELETAKKEFAEQKEAYDLISDETIAAINDATKEEEYFIEYLWVTLGNYATKHNLSLSVVEPGGNVNGTSATATTTQSDETAVSTGTGVTGNSTGVTSTTNAATTGSPTSGTEGGAVSETSSTSNTLTSNATALTVQVKGSYIDLADFVFEVENDKSLRFRLDNISMKSAGGTEVITSFNVKDFTVLKSLEIVDTNTAAEVAE